MKKYLIISIILLGILFAKEIKIGFVESERIFNEYQATAAANAEFNEYVSMYRDSAAVLFTKVENLKSELEAQKLVLSEEARLRKLDEIETSTGAYNQFLQDVFGKGGKLEQKNDELMAPLLKQVNEAVEKIAQQEGFSIILDLSADVFYASSELDLTDLVIDELNLEYGPPTLPTGEIKKIIAIFPFTETNQEAIDAALGQRCQTEVYNAVGAFSARLRIISQAAINTEIIKRGLGRDIELDQAYAIGLAVLCDYIIVGSVSKFATKIEYTISLQDVTTKKEIAKRSNEVSEDIKLYEAINSDLRAMLEVLY
ncbi:MAG: OmpH family outer membrane protein [candidate division WOR-3 bacterium]|nr:MAG: OmpH family outer membrane protein [candidate division WOR-3 bacterium]